MLPKARRRLSKKGVECLGYISNMYERPPVGGSYSKFARDAIAWYVPIRHSKMNHLKKGMGNECTTVRRRIDVYNDMVDMRISSNYVVVRDDESSFGVWNKPVGEHYVDCKSIQRGPFKKEFQTAQTAYGRYEDAKEKYLRLNPTVPIKFVSNDGHFSMVP